MREPGSGTPKAVQKLFDEHGFELLIPIVKPSSYPRSVNMREVFNAIFYIFYDGYTRQMSF